MITKRHLGILSTLAGAAAIVFTLGFDVIRGKPVSIVQLGIIAAGAVLVAAGVALIPLGDRPA